MRSTCTAAALAAICSLSVHADSGAPKVETPKFTVTLLNSLPVIGQLDGIPQRQLSKQAPVVRRLATSESGRWKSLLCFRGIEGDQGLVVKSPAAHHAISAPFSKTLDNKDKTLVVQYEVKLQNGLECGGAYLKLLKESPTEFSDKTEYSIMFGPDRCGATNKVHFIFRHKNPKTGEYEEKHYNSPPAIKNVKTTSLYTLIVRPDQTFEIRIDDEEAGKGSLLEDFEPSVNPSKEIDDPEDKKPEDWVEDSKIVDPEAKKPEDWDEDAPREILDEEAVKPAGWLDDEPLTIPDPDAEKPEEWDDEEDGDWVPPSVPNSKCEDAPGCGAWVRPMKSNPAYKGKWTPSMIDNPAYKGVWAPKKIPNPNYFEDKVPSNFEPMAGIGFELWTMQENILFDNIYIGHSEKDAATFAKETFHVKVAVEKKLEDASKPEEPVKPSTESIPTFAESPVQFARGHAKAFIDLAMVDFRSAVNQMPSTAMALGGLLATVLGALFLVLTGSSAPATKKVKKSSKSSTSKDKAPEKSVTDVPATADATGKAEGSSDVRKRK
ncbi:hypothetical protein PSHT_02746 [Puccinia striiformis]|uniref:Calnexin n=1 Tax=Puccinia striiformis TaxID=27350 RepID=A0A2S4WHD4_9BASI|nr:hypothetical protein PSHT_02746 [Puccinia striiformis]